MHGLSLFWLRPELVLKTGVLVGPPKVRVLSRYLGIAYKRKC